MVHTALLKRDICQIASAKAQARRKNTVGGLDYLRARIWRELEERWSWVEDNVADDAVGDGALQQVLLLDFAGVAPQLGDAVTIRHMSPLESMLESPDTTPPNFFERNVGVFDGVIIGLQLAWLEAEVIIAQSLRVLKPGGRLLFCTFGPDTLAQLRWAWNEVDEYPHVHPFLDMHLLGDQLLQCGSARPIVDVDRVTVEYENADLLYADLRGAGFTNALQTRRKTLTGKARFNQFTRALDSLREAGAPLAITYELIYGTAHAPSSALSSTQVRVAPPEIIR